MVEVVLHPPAEALAPSEQIVKAANAVTRVTDSTGRDIGFKKVMPLEKFRLLEIVGGENAKNEQYLGWAMLAASAVDIDGEKFPPLTSKRAIEARVVQLGDEGLDAIAKATAEKVMAETTDEDVRERIKNALSTPASD